MLTKKKEDILFEKWGYFSVGNNGSQCIIYPSSEPQAPVIKLKAFSFAKFCRKI